MADEPFAASAEQLGEEEQLVRRYLEEASGLFVLAAPAEPVQRVQHLRPRFAGAARALCRTLCTGSLVLSRCKPSS